MRKIEDGGRLLLQHAPAAKGYTVLAARDGSEALQICPTDTGPIRRWLTDIAMPGLGSGELADRAVRLRPDIKVLFMSSHATARLPPSRLTPG
ncbi:hypothetical protein [Nitrospira sp. Kam-Ns4a]